MQNVIVTHTYKGGGSANGLAHPPYRNYEHAHSLRTDWHGIETKKPSQAKSTHGANRDASLTQKNERPARGVRESTWWPALETVPEDMWGVASGGCRYRLNGAKPPAAKALCVKPAVAINSPATVTVALVLAGSLASDGRF